MIQLKLIRITADTVENTLGIKGGGGEGSAGGLLPIILDRKVQWLVDNTRSLGAVLFKGVWHQQDFAMDPVIREPNKRSQR